MNSTRSGRRSSSSAVLLGDDAAGDHGDHAAHQSFLRRWGEAGEDLRRAALATLAEVGDEALDGRVVALHDNRPGDHRLDHAEAGQVRIGREEAEHRRNPGPDRPRPVVDLVESLRDMVAQLLHHRLVGDYEALVLAREVLVEGAAGDRRGTGDMGDGRSRVAVLRARLREPGDQPLALVVNDELAWQAVAARWQPRQLGLDLRRLSPEDEWIDRSAFLPHCDHTERLGMLEAVGSVGYGYEATSVRTVPDRSGLHRQGPLQPDEVGRLDAAGGSPEVDHERRGRHDLLVVDTGDGR